VTSGVGQVELRARERRALNEITLDEQKDRAPDEPAEFDCECGQPRCGARIRLTPRMFEAFRRDFRAFVVAPGHELVK
jgi:hypothetical protein